MTDDLRAAREHLYERAMASVGEADYVLVSAAKLRTYLNLAVTPDADREGLDALIDRALLAEALFEARIGIPQDTPLLADALRPPLLRLIEETLAARSSSPDSPRERA